MARLAKSTTLEKSRFRLPFGFSLVFLSLLRDWIVVLACWGYRGRLLEFILLELCGLFGSLPIWLRSLDAG